ncbi:MAG: hypothetical protein HY906_11380, partial [Deltaproteobacteria bacterium]|nr:hypothetical protein [Deltaproteobacteria bacterium]
MLTCPTCGATLEPGARFCPPDGTPVGDEPSTEVEVEVRRMTLRGAAVAPPGAAPPVAPPPAAPAPVLPPLGIVKLTPLAPPPAAPPPAGPLPVALPTAAP